MGGSLKKLVIVLCDPAAREWATGPVSFGMSKRGLLDDWTQRLHEMDW